MILTLIVLLMTCPAFGQLHLLNAFPDKTNFTKFSLGYEDAEIEADTLNFASYAKNDKNLIAKITYGRKLTENSYALIELPYIYSEESSLKYGENSDEDFTSQGVREPTFGYSLRVKDKLDNGRYFTDLNIHYTPKIFEKTVGGHDANKYSGRHVIVTRITTGALYDKYEAIIGAQATYNTKAKEDNLKSDVDYEFEPYFSSRAFISVQMAYNRDLFPFLTSGITFVEDYEVKGVNGQVTIQQGTGTFVEFGAKKLLEKGFAQLRFNYTSNDYFTESQQLGNFRGEFYQLGVQSSYTYEY